MSKICRKKSIISYTSDVGLQPWITSWEHLLQLFQKGLRLEVFWDVVVQSCDYLVDLLFPRRINVLAGSDGLKEFFEGLFNDPAEAVGYLQNMDLVNGCPRASKEPRTFDTFVTVKVCIRNLNSAASFSNAKLHLRGFCFLMQSGWAGGGVLVTGWLSNDWYSWPWCNFADRGQGLGTKLESGLWPRT